MLKKNTLLKTILLTVAFLSGSANAVTYIFVSFSMNDEALKAYYSEAQKNDATLIMKGLVNDSFTETKEKLDELNIGYDINPELFDKYEVKTVPTIIKDDDGNIKKLTGHILLSEALNIFKEN